MYIYATRVLNKVPNTFFFFLQKKKKTDLWKTITPVGLVPQIHCFVTSQPPYPHPPSLFGGRVAQCWLWDNLAQLRWQWCHNGINTWCFNFFFYLDTTQHRHIRYISLLCFHFERRVHVFYFIFKKCGKIQHCHFRANVRRIHGLLTTVFEASCGKVLYNPNHDKVGMLCKV